MKRYLFTLIIVSLLSNSLFGINIRKYSINVHQEKDSIFYRLYESADSLYRIGYNEEALKLILSLSDQIDPKENLSLFSKTNILIGKIWLNAGAQNSAITYLKRGLKIKIDQALTSNSNSIDSTLINDSDYLEYNYLIGKCFHQLLEKEEDLSKIQIFSDSTLYYYDKSINISSSNREIQLLNSKSFNNLSGFYMRENNIKKAEYYAIKSLKTKKKLGDKYLIATGYSSLANVDFVKKDYESMRDNIKKALEILDGLYSKKAQEIRAALYSNLSYALYLLRDYQAYEYQEQYMILKDSLKQDFNEKMIAKIYADRNFEKGKQEGIFQEELKRERAERNNWILGISLTSVILFLGFLLNQFKLRQKNLKLALAQKETELQIKELNATVKGQETERKRISRELHDGVLGRLFGSRIGLGYLELDGDSNTQEQYQNFLKELQNIEKDIRQVSHELSSDISLSETSFLNAVNELLKEKSRLGGFDFQLKMDDSFSWKDLSGTIEMNLFRILQESLLNILKYAKANRVLVEFKVDKGVLSLVIQDNGIGFDGSKTKKGIGIKNIKSRVKDLDGKLQLDSKINEGTTLSIKIPLK